ncbi:sugar-binding protein [Waddlia chondrophila]|uniref:Carbohydrate-binding domain-containing protein n=1 Tax=Waddlia chondrophila (strain ATCC VR-1470 / WSU 86-1044) TaxID=716544 RepID=D6YU26_WADCW|nr:sugar-binding protein [Waddlia chondrophila]ADI37637.1 conserved hypothetical protein [Waddlia chondrophila WSU 86-1044]
MHELSPVTPINFFQLSADLLYLSEENGLYSLDGKNRRRYLLPDTSVLCGEENFAEASMGWCEKGLAFYFKVDHPFERSYYPDVYRGDSVEVFIDTRDVKTSGYNTRFCHHFFFLPEPLEGIQAGEMTHFRTEDRHELCDAELLKVKAKKTSKGYDLQGWIPSGCLVGYDPGQFQRIGLTYRINRNAFVSQHFSVISDDYRLEEQPSLWSQMRLVR